MTAPAVTTVSVDVGGTFTDVTAIGPDGGVLSAKVLSTPPDFSKGIIEGIEQACGAGRLPPHLVIHGTTVATNAILSRSGLGRAAVVTTRGFRDVLEIGRTKRPNLYDLDWDKAAPVVPRDLVFELDERTEPDGRVTLAPSEEQLEGLAGSVRVAGVAAVAVCLVNSYANQDNEHAVAEHLRAAGCVRFVLCSTDLTREIQEFERTSTAALNAVLLEPVNDYVDRLSGELSDRGATGLLVMQSNGGLIPGPTAAERPVALLESGPAAGVLGAAKLAQALGLDKVIAFDMGGTTAKACLIEDGVPREAVEYEVGGELNTANPLLRGGGYPVRLPCLELCEVGAGGGSIAWVDGAGALRVGPESAGSLPGPACYDRGGTAPTVADAQLVLGYLPQGGLGGGTVPLRADLAREAIRVQIAGRLGTTVEEAAAGIFALANTTMARAIRAVSVERGRDPSEYTLVAFGGSGPVHAVETARELGMRRVVVPSLAGVFSSLGMTGADLRRDAGVSLHWQLDAAVASDLCQRFGALEAELRGEYAAMSVELDGLALRRSVDVRYRGQSGRIEVLVPDEPDPEKILRAFEDEHEQLFGHRSTGDVVEIVAVRVTAVVRGSGADILTVAPHGSPKSEAAGLAYFGATGWQDLVVLEGRDGLRGGRAGPLLVSEANTTVLVTPGCTASLAEGDVIVVDVPAPPRDAGLEVTGLSMEVVRHRLEAIVDDMAALIPQSARSIIARESHDFSTALCAPDGQLVAQGLGGLIHLGSVPGAMEAVAERFGDDLHPGDVFLLNDPYEGGTHLPDMIVVAPLFGGARLLGYAVVISHHSDVGGGVPGGHATGATDLFQEGIVIPPVRLMRGGVIDDDMWRLVQRNTRTPADVAGDLRAQLAACAKAGAELRQLGDEVGHDALLGAMGALIDYTERLARRAISALPRGRYTATDHLDDDGSGRRIDLTVDLTIAGDRVTADFSRSSAEIANGLNCNRGTLSSAVFLGFRCVLDVDIPDNAGFARCFEILAEPGTIVSPHDPAPVAARGLTGFRLADLMFKALAQVAPDRVWAAGEGGLNVVTIGGRQGRRPYLLMDTIGGGSGARPTKDGVEGVAPAIGNVRNNSVEVMERDFPIRIHRYGFVADTGGRGRHRGANAMVREYELLGDRAIVFVRSDRRLVRPWGLAGGGDGAPSTVELRRAAGDGDWEQLAALQVFTMERGDWLRSMTAGAGGHGPPAERTTQAIERDRREGRTTR